MASLHHCEDPSRPPDCGERPSLPALRRPARRPQLKRDPLGGADTWLRPFRIHPSLARGPDRLYPICQLGTFT